MMRRAQGRSWLMGGAAALTMAFAGASPAVAQGTTNPAPEAEPGRVIISEFTLNQIAAWMEGNGLESSIETLSNGQRFVGVRTPEDYQVPGANLADLRFVVSVICDERRGCSQLEFNAFFQSPEGMGAQAVNAYNMLFADQKMMLADQETLVLQSWVPATFGITREQLNFRLGHFIGSIGRLRSSMGASAAPRQNVRLPDAARNMAGSIRRGVEAAAFAGDPGRGGLPPLSMKEPVALPRSQVNR